MFACFYKIICRFKKKYTKHCITIFLNNVLPKVETCKIRHEKVILVIFIQTYKRIRGKIHNKTNYTFKSFHINILVSFSFSFMNIKIKTLKHYLVGMGNPIYIVYNYKLSCQSNQ